MDANAKLKLMGKMGKFLKSEKIEFDLNSRLKSKLELNHIEGDDVPIKVLTSAIAETIAETNSSFIELLLDFSDKQ
jgi:hypothetical protein